MNLPLRGSWVVRHRRQMEWRLLGITAEGADLVAVGERYTRDTGYPIQYPWTLIEGVNEGDDEIDSCGRGRPATPSRWCGRFE